MHFYGKTRDEREALLYIDAFFVIELVISAIPVWSLSFSTTLVLTICWAFCRTMFLRFGGADPNSVENVNQITFWILMWLAFWLLTIVVVFHFGL